MKDIIIDLDGVCFDPTERIKRSTIKGGKIDWGKVFENIEVEKDPVIVGSVQATQKISKKYHIVYMTSRSTRCKHATFSALVKYNFGHNQTFLAMRGEGDYRPDHEVKLEMIQNYKINRRFVAAIDDDHTGNLKPMYESVGIRHFYSFKEFFESDLWEED